jgi:hypothetical protein
VDKLSTSGSSPVLLRAPGYRSKIIQFQSVS